MGTSLKLVCVAAFTAATALLLAAAPACATDDPKQEATADTASEDTTPGKTKDRPLVIFGYATKSRIDFGATDQDWSIIGAGLAVPLRQSATLTFEASRETRVKAQYARLSARYEAGLEEALHYYVEAAIGSGAPVRENWSVSAGASRKLDDWIAATLDTRLARYDLAALQGGASTITASPGVRINPANTGIELTAKWINFWDQDKNHRQGFGLAGAYYYGDANYVFAGMARYPETDTGITRTMRSFHAGFRHVVSERFSVRLTAEQLTRQQSYRQRGLTLGLEFRL